MEHLEILTYGKPINAHETSELINLGGDGDGNKYIVPIAHFHKVMRQHNASMETKEHSHNVVKEAFHGFVKADEQQKVHTQSSLRL